jgi:hypothetical protein
MACKWNLVAGFMNIYFHVDFFALIFRSFLLDRWLRSERALGRPGILLGARI